MDGQCAENKMIQGAPPNISSRINREYLREVQERVGLSLRQINDGAGLGNNYIYKLLSEVHPISPTLATLDKLCNFLMRKFWELAMEPPSDLWSRLIVHEVAVA